MRPRFRWTMLDLFCLLAIVETMGILWLASR